MMKTIIADWKKPKLTEVARSTKKFDLFVDLGIITVPCDYVHESRFKKFSKQENYKSSFFYYCNGYDYGINDENFSNPTRIMKPGDKFHVRTFKQTVCGTTTTSEEWLKFLTTQDAVYTGAQGLSLVFDQKNHRLPKGFNYVSIDGKDHLWLDRHDWSDDRGYHMVPLLYPSPINYFFKFYLHRFEKIWKSEYIFLCLTEE